MLLRACDDRRECAIEALEHEPAGLPDLQRQSGVDHVRGREAVVEPPAFRPQGLRDGIDESGSVMVKDRLELGDPCRSRCAGPRDRLSRLWRHHPQLDPGGGGRQLDLEPGRQLALLRPDPGHLGAGVAGDHLPQSRAGL